LAEDTDVQVAGETVDRTGDTLIPLYIQASHKGLNSSGLGVSLRAVPPAIGISVSIFIIEVAQTAYLAFR
jgi:hypothetical protein